jgi:hypothetical protein
VQKLDDLSECGEVNFEYTLIENRENKRKEILIHISEKCKNSLKKISSAPGNKKNSSYG